MEARRCVFGNTSIETSSGTIAIHKDGQLEVPALQTECDRNDPHSHP